MMNGSWDVLEVFFIWWYWVETKGKTLEEIDEKLDVVKHSDVPDLDDILRGEEDLGDILVEDGGNVGRVEVSPMTQSGFPNL